MKWQAEAAVQIEAQISPPDGLEAERWLSLLESVADEVELAVMGIGDCVGWDYFPDRIPHPVAVYYFSSEYPERVVDVVLPILEPLEITKGSYYSITPPGAPRDEAIRTDI